MPSPIVLPSIFLYYYYNLKFNLGFLEFYLYNHFLIFTSKIKMGCFETKTNEENEDGGGQHYRRNNRNNNYEEENDNMEEEEFEDFKEIGSKNNI